MATPASPPQTGLGTVGRYLRPTFLAVGAAGGLLLSGYRCPFLAVTGHYCPGCGGTRALLALLQGDVAGALHNNALALTLFPLALAVGFAPSPRVRRLLERHQTVVIAVAVATTLAFTLARNTVAPGLAPA